MAAEWRLRKMFCPDVFLPTSWILLTQSPFGLEEYLLNTRVACRPSYTQRVNFARSLIFFRRNSGEVTRNRGNLGKKSCEFAPMAAPTRPMCCLRCIRQF